MTQATVALTVTRTLHASCSDLLALRAIAKTLGYVRADLWRRLGALGTYGKTAKDVRKHVTASGWYASLPVDGTIRAETTKDIINDIYAYKEAALLKVRQAVARRTTDNQERKRLYTLLRKDQWLQDSYLHRQMRTHFRHGGSHCKNQFIVRSDRHESAVVDGRLVITIRIAKCYGSDIQLVTTSNGKHVNLAGKNLRVIVQGDTVQIHYATVKDAGRACGTQVIGVDKGYTEAFTDSDGQAHGVGFGGVLTRYSDQVKATGQQRNRLHALEKQHREAGRVAKADRIRTCNLGRKKLQSRKDHTQAQLRGIAYQAAHSLVDKAGVIASEDLSSVIASKVQWKNYNRRMSAWAKGVLAQALQEVSLQRGASHELVNAAYTSQMDSDTGLLQGKRVADKFYRSNGDVLQADHNAARNVLARLYDPDITRYMPYREVKAILLRRCASGATERQVAPVGRRPKAPRQRSADKSQVALSRYL